MALIEIDNLSVHFDAGDRVVRAVEGVSLQVEARESYGLVGESGSGKSTILRAICGLAPITGGSIRIDGKPLPAEGKGLQTCVDSFEELMQDEEFDPSTIAAFDRSMFSAVDNGDGRAEITILGESTEILMVKAEDGKWYIDGDAPF